MLQVDKTRANNAEKTAGNEDGNEGRPPVVTTTTGTAAATDTATPPTTGPDFLRFFENAGGLPPETYVCAVCEEPARGFHFGAFTCEGCKSFFGRTCLRKNHERFECKNSGRCDVVGSNRTSCKACRYRRCVSVGMSPLNSRFGRRSKYFKVSMSTSQHQQQQQQQQQQHKSSITPFPSFPQLVPPPCSTAPILPLSPIFYPFFMSHLLHLYSLHRNSL